MKSYILKEQTDTIEKEVVNDFGSLGIVGAGFTFIKSNLNDIASLIKN